MNRRSILCGLLVFAPALAAIAKGRSGASESSGLKYVGPRASGKLAEASRIVDQNGQMWLAARDRRDGRNPVLIAFDEWAVVEATYVANNWRLRERYFMEREVTELQRYKRTLYPIYKREPKLGDPVGPSKTWTSRGYIKNGRRPDWNMSAEVV